MKNNRYFGFLETVEPHLRAKVDRCLSGESIGKIENHIIGSDVVEEIIRRNGRFYTANEARKVAPFVIENDDSFFASFPYKEGDTATSPDGTRWRGLVVSQYCYGLYLQNLLAEGKITIADISETNKAYA